MLSFLGLVIIVFVIFLALLLFYTRYRRHLPFHQIDQDDCVRLLERALAGELHASEWDYFVGIRIQSSENLEQLRLACLLIDEQHVVGRRQVNGGLYMAFSREGRRQLGLLLDEWRHKIDYMP